MLLTRRLFADGDRLNLDFYNDAFYIRHQAASLRDAHAPSLFLTSGTAAFYPIFAFYGGTLFAAAAALSLVTGSAVSAQAAVYALALASAYGGWYWLARQAGVRRWLAHAPAIAYVTAPYVITNLYARQDLAETVATSAMPLMAAAAISVGRADRLRAGPVAALAVSVIAFTGSHNLTLLFGTIYLVLLAGLVAAAVPASRHLIARPGALRVLAVAVPAVAVNAWFLLPDLVYAHGTAIARRSDDARALLRADPAELSLGHLFTPGRPDDAKASGFTLPVLVLAWSAVAMLLSRPRDGAPWRRLAGLLAGLVAAIAVLMSQAHVLAGLPSPFVLLQSGARLNTFALLGVCGVLVAALATVRRPAPWLVASLGAVLLIGTAQAVQQSAKVPVVPSPLPTAFEGTVTFGLGDYADATLPTVLPPANAQTAFLTHEDVHDGRAELLLTGPPGTMVATNLMGPPDLLKVEGARIVARWPVHDKAGWQTRWFLVLELGEDADGAQQLVTVEPARTLPIVAGRVVSVLGLLGLLGLAVVIALRRAPPRRRSPRPPRRSGVAL